MQREGADDGGERTDGDGLDAWRVLLEESDDERDQSVELGLVRQVRAEVDHRSERMHHRGWAMAIPETRCDEGEHQESGSIWMHSHR